jgi:hypothetical protein
VGNVVANVVASVVALLVLLVDVLAPSLVFARRPPTAPEVQIGAWTGAGLEISTPYHYDCERYTLTVTRYHAELPRVSVGITTG